MRKKHEIRQFRDLPGMTDRRLRVLNFVTNDRLSFAEIARREGLSETTIRNDYYAALGQATDKLAEYLLGHIVHTLKIIDENIDFYQPRAIQGDMDAAGIVNSFLRTKNETINAKDIVGRLLARDDTSASNQIEIVDRRTVELEDGAQREIVQRRTVTREASAPSAYVKTRDPNDTGVMDMLISEGPVDRGTAYDIEIRHQDDEDIDGD